MKKWLVRPANDLVTREVAQLFAQPDIQAECKTVLQVLASEENPAHPYDATLDVKHLEHDAPNWYRLKIAKHNIRFVFSLAYANGDDVVEYKFRELPFENAENYILIQFAKKRADNTYIEVRRRRNLTKK